MGNCATKPKVLKDTDEDLIPVERETAASTDHNKDPAEKSVNNAPNAADEAAAAAAATRRSEKGKEILIEDDVEEHSKRQSLSHLFHEDKAIEKEITDLSSTKPDTTNKSGGASSEVSKLDTSALMTSHVKAPETFDVQTRNDLEVEIPKDSKVKTPETPKAKEAEEQEVNFSENWEVKFPEELEARKTSEVVKVAEESKLPQVSKVSAPELSEVKVTKDPDVPEVLEDKSVREVSEVPPPPPELSEIKVKKDSDVPEVLEDKNVPEVSRVMTNEVKAAASELLKVSEVKSSEDLDIKVPKVFEVKTPETSSVKVGSEVRTDREAAKVKTAEETEVSEFVDAQDKIDKSETQILEDIKMTEDREIAMPKTEEGEKDLSFDKKVKESILSDLDNK